MNHILPQFSFCNLKRINASELLFLTSTGLRAEQTAEARRGGGGRLNLSRHSYGLRGNKQLIEITAAILPGSLFGSGGQHFCDAQLRVGTCGGQRRLLHGSEEPLRPSRQRCLDSKQGRGGEEGGGRREEMGAVCQRGRDAGIITATWQQSTPAL